MPPVELKVAIVDPVEYCARALSVRDTGLYDLHCGLGKGTDRTSLNPRGRSNCSRHVLWLWKLGGLLPSGITAAGYGEVNTTAMYHEARGTKGGRRYLFVEVPVSEARIGDAVVYPGVDKDGDGVRDPGEIGHTGGIVAIPPGATSIAQFRISHCNAGPPPAIDETNGRVFAARGAIVVRLLLRW
jgi:hypothetical protein